MVDHTLPSGPTFPTPGWLDAGRPEHRLAPRRQRLAAGRARPGQPEGRPMGLEPLRPLVQGREGRTFRQARRVDLLAGREAARQRPRPRGAQGPGGGGPAGGRGPALAADRRQPQGRRIERPRAAEHGRVVELEGPASATSGSRRPRRSRPGSPRRSPRGWPRRGSRWPRASRSSSTSSTPRRPAPLTGSSARAWRGNSSRDLDQVHHRAGPDGRRQQDAGLDRPEDRDRPGPLHDRPQDRRADRRGRDARWAGSRG